MGVGVGGSWGENPWKQQEKSPTFTSSLKLSRTEVVRAQKTLSVLTSPARLLDLLRAVSSGLCFKAHVPPVLMVSRLKGGQTVWNWSLLRGTKGRVKGDTAVQHSAEPTCCNVFVPLWTVWKGSPAQWMEHAAGWWPSHYHGSDRWGGQLCDAGRNAKQVSLCPAGDTGECGADSEGTDVAWGGSHVSTSSCCTGITPHTPGYERCRLVLVTSFGTRMCAVVLSLHPPAANVSIGHQQSSPPCSNRRRLLANLRPPQPRRATKNSTAKGVRRRLHTEQLREQRLIVGCPWRRNIFIIFTVFIRAVLHSI